MRTSPALPLLLLIALPLAACGGDDTSGDPDAGPTCDDPPAPFEDGDPDGHADPLGAGPNQARAGRLRAEDLPASEYLLWEPGDFVLANDKIALVIEDVGDSDLYDPWGGRPVGMARVENGRLVEPGAFGEHFFMTGRSTVATVAVTVLNDGSDGQAAVIRARGNLAPLPFLATILYAVYPDELDDIEAVLDYVLEPGAEEIDIYYRYASRRARNADTGNAIHGFMFTKRMPVMVPGRGFTEQVGGATWVQLVDDGGTSWAYMPPEEPLSSPIAQSGFVGAFSSTLIVPACRQHDRHYARIVIGGPGLDGIERARARVEDRQLRAITGTVTDGAGPVAGARVHAVGPSDSYLSRVTTAADGTFTIHVPADQRVTLTAYKRGWATATAEVAAGTTTADVTMPRPGAIAVTAREGVTPLPVRVQVFPAGTTTIPQVPATFGEPEITPGRLHIEYPMNGQVTLPVPAGQWRVVVSRGYEYDLFEQTVTVGAGATVPVLANLARVVDTTGQLCGDFHIHTSRSNDSGDHEDDKIRSAVADGLELPVRTDHEWVDTFAQTIERLGVGAWAMGIGAVELTSFFVWGHMNVFPLDPSPTAWNRGAPRWAEWPTPEQPGRKVRNLDPTSVFAEIRSRPGRPAIIINHPRSNNADYFNYVGLDRATGMITRNPDAWDDEFTLIEVFNDSGWLANRDSNVADWFTLLNAGRSVFAVGSSDSHGISYSPVGYPRTCIDVGTDDPRTITGQDVKTALVAGHATVSGGVYVTATVAERGPGETATGLGATADLEIVVQAAPWIDVDAIDVVVDGQTMGTIPIEPDDGDPLNPAVRFRGTVPVPVAASGSWVVVAAYGDESLAPVHPGRLPFGVTNPIWMAR